MVSDAGDSRVVYTLKPLKTGTSQLTITSQIPDAEGKYPSESFTLDVKDAQVLVSEASQEQTFTMKTDVEPLTIEVTQAVKGCTIETNWGTGGKEWFTLSSNEVNAMEGGSMTITVMLKNDLSAFDKVKEATITFKNKITNGGDATVKITPKWQAPTNKEGQAKEVFVYKGGALPLDINLPSIGGVNATSTDASVVTATVNESNQVVLIPATNAISGNATVYIYNKQLNYSDLKEEDKLAYVVNVENGAVTVGDLDWAVGNLIPVGKNGCKISQPHEVGVYFRWGSLVAYQGGNGQTPIVKPLEYTASPTFNDAPTAPLNGYITDNKATGIGDPCRVYLGGKWRLPTNDEYGTLGGASNAGDPFTKSKEYTVQGVDGIRIPETGEQYIFLPLTGYLQGNDGNVAYPNHGLTWTSTFIKDNGEAEPDRAYRLSLIKDINSGSISASMTSSPVVRGFPIRCVRDR